MPGLKVVAVTSVVVVLTLLCIAISSTYTRTAEGAGWLDYYPDVATLVVPESGTVVRILRPEGSSVEVGQPILEYSKDRSLNARGKLGADLLHNLNDELQEVDRQIALRRTLSEIESARVRAESEALTRDYEALMSSSDMLAIRVRRAEERVARMDLAAEQGHVARNVADDARDELLELKLQEKQIGIELSGYQQRISRVDADLQQRSATEDILISELQARRSDLLSRLAQIEADRGGYVAAPIAGRVEELSVVPGDSIGGAGAVGRIVPEGSVLAAYVLVPAGRSGLIKPGVRVRIMYDSFSSQRYGFFDGTVVEVAPSVMSRELQQQRFPISAGEPAFLAKVALTSTKVTGDGVDTALRQGLTLRAKFDLGEKPVFESIAAPMFRLWERL